MTPYYKESGITIYHGDCREILPLLDPVDLILTDPPYGIDYVTAWRSRNDKLRSPIQNDSDLACVAEAWKIAIGILKNDRHWYSFASPRMIPIAAEIFENSKHILAWDKGDRGTVGDLECGFGEAWEAIFYGMKGRRPLNGKRPRTIIRYDWSGTMDPLHPTVKPIDLLSRLISWSSNIEEVILDMFCGSGTTLAAAKLLGRHAIGIDIHEAYCEIAANRLRQGVLFGVSV